MILGIDLGGTHIRVGQITDGKIAQKISAPSPSKMRLDESIAYLKSTISCMMTPEVKRIGIGVPSVVDLEKGVVYNVANIPAWEEVHLKAILEAEFHVPVYINNDSNCFALGEKRFGEGIAFENMIGITLGTGVGAGVIVGGELYSGRNTGAGEIGCLPYLEATYEHYCGSAFFTTYHQTTGKEAARQAFAGEAHALEIWNEFGRHIGKLVQAILFVYDPEAIIWGGGIIDAFPLFSKSMEETICTFPYPRSLDNLQIRISKNPDIAILGASAL